MAQHESAPRAPAPPPASSWRTGGARRRVGAGRRRPRPQRRL